MDPATLTRLAGAMARMNDAPDTRSNLLYALKPFLREERRKRVEEAAQVLKWVRILELFREGS